MSHYGKNTTKNNNMFQRGRYSLLLLLFFPMLSWGQTKPVWVENKPVSPGYYIGVGIASKKSNTIEDAKGIATKMAISDIAMQIQVGIESSSRLTTQEDDSSISTQYRNEINTKAQIEEINHIEIVDLWVGPNDIWVYARLSKEAYENEIRLKEDNIKKEALALYEQYQAKEEENVTQRIKLLLQAIGLIYTHKVQNISTNYRGSTLLIDTLLTASIQRETENVRLSPVQSIYKIKSGSNLKQNIDIRVSIDLNGASFPLSNFPVHMYLENEADGLFDPTYFSDDNGIVAGQLVKVNANKQKLKGFAVANYFALIDEGESQKHPALIQLTSNLDPAPIAIHFETTSRTIFARYNSGEMEDSIRQYLQLEFKKAISSTGLVYTEAEEDIDKADLCMNVVVSQDRSSRAGNISFAYISFDLDIKDCKTDELKLNLSRNGVKGGGGNLTAARYKAAQKYVKDDIGDIANRLLRINLQ